MTYCPRFIHTLYCDDVRQEVGGKMTFVGAYQTQMLADQPGPLFLPKLCIVLTAQTPHDQPFHKLKIKIYRDEDVLQEMDVPIVPEAQAPVKNDIPVKFDVHGVILAVQGITFEKDTILRVRVETEAEELSAPALQIILKDPPLPEAGS
jgi:hypothetical protein